ncbi:MAG: YicC family protein [candidate division Zixibacteria bacterium]|nr:YicC family protein [candidate division Zixibacteria bacterium]
MKSMTGFGRADLRRQGYKLHVELASVNSRFLECVFRMPRILAGAEGKVKELIGQKLLRGKVTVTVILEETPDAAAQSVIDVKAVTAFHAHLTQIQKKLNLPGEVELGHILAFSQMLTSANEGMDEERLWPDLKTVVLQAVADLEKMRATEGRNLQRDLARRLKAVSKLVVGIERQAPQDVLTYKQRLEKRISDLTDGAGIDAQRIAEEVTVFADRSDVTEECIRLRSHVDMFAETLKGDGEAGKRLNFILQEMGREANTIGSKALSSATSTYAIQLKEEIEKLREQAQNIE